MTALSANTMRSVQRLGIRQTLTQDGDALDVNGKSPQKCSFCKSFHVITRCDKLIFLQRHTKCYKLNGKPQK